MIVATIFLSVAGAVMIITMWAIAVDLVVDAYKNRSFVPIVTAAGVVGATLALTGIGLQMVMFRWPTL